MCMDLRKSPVRKASGLFLHMNAVKCKDRIEKYLRKSYNRRQIMI